MILNPISIATNGVYANDRNVALASKGYIDITQVTPEPEQEQIQAGGAMWGHEEPRFNDDDRVIMAVIKEFLQIIH